MAWSDEERQRVVDFVAINQYYMTQTQIADELKVSVNAIVQICDEHGFKPVTQAELVEDYIRENPHLTQEDVQEKFNFKSIASVGKYMKNAGVYLNTRFQVKNKMKVEEAQKEQKKEIIRDSKEIINAKQFIYDSTGINVDKPAKKYKRAPAVYNQSGSDVMDQLNNIVTTKRCEVKASDAFFR